MGKRKIKYYINLRSILSLNVMIVILQLLIGLALASKSGHVEQYLDSVEVCSSTSGGSSKLGPLSEYLGGFTRKKLRLANFPNNTVIVKLTRWDQMWTSFYNYRCMFSVTAPKKMGVMMTIQSLHLRTATGGSAGPCRDFIKVKQDNDMWTTPICGEVESADKIQSPSTLVGRRFVSSTKGEIDVMFNTHNDTKLEHDADKALWVELVFTAFSDCSAPNVVKALEANTMKQCSLVRKMSCIPKALWCDGVVHCGFDDDFAADESDCTGENHRENRELKKSMSMYVFAVTALSTLVVVIVCVLIGCCFIRKFQKPPRNAHFSRASMYDTELNMNSSGPPSAPPLTLDRGISSPNSKSEDLPPPYDALFPGNEASTDSGMKKK